METMQTRGRAGRSTTGGPGRAPTRRGRPPARLLAGFLLGLGLLGPPAAAALAAPARAPQLADASAPSFVTYARGRALAPAELRSAPGAGRPLGRVTAEAELAIGGSVRYRAGLLPATALWVHASTEDGPPRYGFLPAEAVRLTAGAPRALDLAGVHPEQLLHPADGGRAIGRAATDDGIGERAGVPVTGELEPASLGTDLQIAWLPATVARWSRAIQASAAQHGIDPQLLAIVLLVESGGDPEARSSAGALGLAQVMPGTAAGIASARGLPWAGPDALLEPETAIDFGAWYLSRQLARFGLAQDPDWQRSVELAAAAYNGGPGTVERHLAGAQLPAETVRYQRWVGGMWRERGATSSTTYLAWWQAGGRHLVEAAARDMSAAD